LNANAKAREGGSMPSGRTDNDGWVKEEGVVEVAEVEDECWDEEMRPLKLRKSGCNS
jgi:hypothetical protein